MTSRDQSNKPKLFDTVRHYMRIHDHSFSTERTYLYWIKRYILFHEKRHPMELDATHISDFISDLAINKNVSYSTQKLALSAILFLYREVFDRNIWKLDKVVWAKRPTKSRTAISKIKSSRRKLKIFLCHASEDKRSVRDLYLQLKRDGANPWFDKESLLPGQDWQLEIEKEVRNSHAVIVCLSKKSITKTGYVQKEIKVALDIADEQPEGTIFVIPLKLEECVVPDRLKRWHWVNHFQKNGPSKLTQALSTRANSL